MVSEKVGVKSPCWMTAPLVAVQSSVTYDAPENDTVRGFCSAYPVYALWPLPPAIDMTLDCAFAQTLIVSSSSVVRIDKTRPATRPRLAFIPNLPYPQGNLGGL